MVSSSIQFSQFIVKMSTPFFRIPAEMGLGKTIMLAALILTNRPGHKIGEYSSDDTDDSSAEESDATFVPSPVKLQKRSTATQQQTRARQARLNLGSSKRVKDEDDPDIIIEDDDVKHLSTITLVKSAKKAHATLVVAPVTLLGQWRDELLRASGKRLRIVFYYGASRGDVSLEDELEDGADIILTR
jgi:DNA repair protein RAD5